MSHLWPRIAAVTTWHSAGLRPPHRGATTASRSTASASACRTGAGRRPGFDAHAAQATERSRRAARRRSGAYTLNRSPRTKPTSVRLRAAGGVDRERRRRAHRDEGAEPGGPRLLHHLEARPPADEQPEPGAPGARPASSIAPTTLSTALWRPTSSRTQRDRCRRRSNTAAACTAPVAAEQRLLRRAPGRARERSSSSGIGVVGAAAAPGGGTCRRAVRCRTTRSSTTSCRAGRRHRRPAAGLDGHDVELAVDRADPLAQ